MPKDKIPQGILIHVHANDGQKKHKQLIAMVWVFTSQLQPSIISINKSV
jgi:hypothetical protein